MRMASVDLGVKTPTGSSWRGLLADGQRRAERRAALAAWAEAEAVVEWGRVPKRSLARLSTTWVARVAAEEREDALAWAGHRGPEGERASGL